MTNTNDHTSAPLEVHEALETDVLDPKAIADFTEKYGAEYGAVIYEAACKWHDLMQAIERGEKAIIPKDRLKHYETNSRDIEVVNYENGWNDAINYIKKGIE